jgi:Na+/proline symporter
MNLRKLYVTVVGALFAAVVFAGNALAAADPALTTQTDTIKAYFTDNIGTVIGLFIAVAGLLWMFSLAVRSAGAQRRSKAG